MENELLSLDKEFASTMHRCEQMLTNSHVCVCDENLSSPLTL